MAGHATWQRGPSAYKGRVYPVCEYPVPMSLPKFKRILLKLSGEVLMGNQQFGIDTDFVDRLAAE
jgi:uridylate kinase